MPAVGKPAGLILLKILPFRETVWRYLVFDTRSRTVVRADGIGQGCRGLPEDHGIVFPGGFVLVGGEHKVFDGDRDDYVLERELRSPNGEDVLYVYLRARDGTYLLYPYNLIDKAIAAPIQCSGYSLFPDGRMIVLRSVTEEPARVHPMQVWRTPFTSAEHAASAPVGASYLGKVGNADLVRGLSDALSIARLAGADVPRRTTFEDILALGTRAIDAYYWLGHADAGDLEDRGQRRPRDGEADPRRVRQGRRARGRGEASARRGREDRRRAAPRDAPEGFDASIRSSTR